MAIEQVPAYDPGEDAEAHVRENVRVLLALRRLRMKHLAAHLGLSPQGVSRRMTGETEWGYKEVARTAAFLGVPIGRLQSDPATAWGAGGNGGRRTASDQGIEGESTIQCKSTTTGTSKARHLKVAS